MGLSPDPMFPEKGENHYDEKFAPSLPGNRGPLRFEEGVATDTSVPNDFERGLLEGMIPAPGRINHVNPSVQYKHAQETLQERAHLGSAAWIDSPAMLGEFAHGSFTAVSEDRYEEVTRSGGRQARPAPSRVTD